MADILLVDDEKSLRITLSAFLRKEGHRVMTCENVTEAKDLLLQKKFSCVFTDILMEDGSGIDVLSFAKKKHPSAQVILITGYPNLDTATDALRLGAYDYLTKPVLKDSLLKVTKAALAHFEVKNNNESLLKEANEARKHLNSKLREQKVEIDHLHKSVQQKYDTSEKKAILDANLTQVELPEDCINIDVLTDNIVRKALELSQNNKQKTARYLCISRDVLRSKLKHLEPEDKG
jgi:DNA-binding NtrC family response regulator